MEMQFKPGDKVVFHCPIVGQVKGHITAIILDISNGQRCAKVRPEGCEDWYFLTEPCRNLHITL